MVVPWKYYPRKSFRISEHDQIALHQCQDQGFRFNYSDKTVPYVLYLFSVTGMLYFYHGDVFDCPASHSMAHCVSADAKMSKGVAVKFVSRFPQLVTLRKVSNIVGTAAPVPDGPRFVYCLFTKSRFWMKPTSGMFYQCLRSMLIHAELHVVTDISVPKLGSGCDLMDFEDVVIPMMKQLFSGSSINIHIYYYGTVFRYVYLDLSHFCD